MLNGITLKRPISWNDARKFRDIGSTRKTDERYDIGMRSVRR
jgi:hypothetical protein